MNDLIPRPGWKENLFNGRDIRPGRRSGGARTHRMVFKAESFPKTIRENIIWGARINGFQGDPDELVETSLRQVYLWDEVKDKLKKNAYELSGGQQQRLCIARAIAVSPEILLMDEPTSALDPISTGKIEDLMTEFKERFTIIIVTHNMQQAGRISDDTAFFLNGILVEMGPTREIFFTPKDPAPKTIFRAVRSGLRTIRMSYTDLVRNLK